MVSLSPFFFFFFFFFLSNVFGGNEFGAVNTGSGTLDARHNHWGHATGPLLGDAVHGDVEYTPWCTLSNCVV